MVVEISLELRELRRSGRPKIVDSESVLQAIEASPVIRTRRVSGLINITQSIAVRNFHKKKALEHTELSLTLPKYCKTFDSP